MTWAELKQALEDAGITETDEVLCLEVTEPESKDTLHIVRHDDGSFSVGMTY